MLNKKSLLSTFVSAAMASPLFLHAAPITWGLPTDISADTDVSTNGVLVEAVNAASSAVTTDLVVNGVTFESRDLLPSNFGGDFFSDPNGDFPNISGDYEQLLSNIDLGGGTVRTIQVGGGDLIEGLSYELQVWFVDTRFDPGVRVMTFSDGGNTSESVDLVSNPGQFATGTFIADGSSQSLRLQSNDFANVHITAYQVRLLSPPPLLVTTLTDELDSNSSDGSGLSLREAIRDAENGELIRFSQNLNGGMIQLDASLGELLIDKDLTISAANLSDGIIIDGGSNGDDIIDENEVRCFHITDGDRDTKRDVTFVNLTLQNGSTAGGGGNIFTLENLTLQACRILNGFTTGSGGGIAGQSNIELTLESCTVDGNRSLNGGAGIVVSQAKVALTGCTLSRNSSDGQGSAFLFDNAEAFVTRCTIVQNTGDRSAVRLFRGSCRFTHCTIVGNQSSPTTPGGIEASLQICTLDSCIVRDNVGDDLFGSATFVSDGRENLIGTGNDLSAFSAEEISSAPLLLAPLANYGGPTETRPPLLGSPVIRLPQGQTVGDPDFADQRGFGQFGSPDIGAVEFQGENQELELAFDTDGDRDGLSVGIELAIGSDPFVTDFDHPGRPQMEVIDGFPTFAFGSGTPPIFIVLSVERSEDLSSGSFREVDFIDVSGGDTPAIVAEANEHIVRGIAEIPTVETIFTEDGPRVRDISGDPRAFFRLRALLNDFCD